jgi:Tol biopolymer transport system component
LGPYIQSYERDLIKDGFNRHYGEYLMLFASDRTGNLDIYLTHNYRNNPTGVSAIPGSTTATANKTFSDSVPVAFLNSPADDGYPTFDQNDKSVYFTSNWGGTFAIFKATLPAIAHTELQNQLPVQTAIAIGRVAELSSSSDDKCPFISGNRLVFTSNRPGGYDLYYSQWDGSILALLSTPPAMNTGPY